MVVGGTNGHARCWSSVFGGKTSLASELAGGIARPTNATPVVREVSFQFPKNYMTLGGIARRVQPANLRPFFTSSSAWKTSEIECGAGSFACQARMRAFFALTVLVNLY